MIKKFTFAKTLMLFALFSFIFIGCDSDDEEMVIIDEANLVGATWTYSSVDSEEQLVEILVDAFTEGHKINFIADNTYTDVDLGFEGSGIWKFENNVLTLDEGDEFEEIYTVIELSNSTMKLNVAASTIDGETYAAHTLTYTK